ncbi:MAG: acyltransferase, partial [Sphingobacteriales bacterium]
LLVMFLGYLMIPVTIPFDIRGWQETYPLNGPAWSLFFEYIANIAYALILRRLPTAILGILTGLAGYILIKYAVTNPGQDLVGGWSLNHTQLEIGFTRLAYPFLAGMFLYKLFKPMNTGNIFLLCSLFLVLVLSVPRVGSVEASIENGMYDAFVVIVLFPVVIYFGACSTSVNKKVIALCNFLGNISYPLYIVHFPLAYIYYAWIVNNGKTLAQAWPAAVMVFTVSILLAYGALKFYDLPVRKWLSRKL